MQACAYLHAIAGVVFVGALAVGSCGGAPAQVASPAPSASSEPPSDTPPVVAPAPSAPGSTAAAASAPKEAPRAAPDRNMNDIQAVVSSNRDTFRECYDASLKNHPGIKGKFVLTFVVSPDGTVKSAQEDQASSQVHTVDLETCAVAAVRKLKFPPSRKGMESTVNYPFDFNPRGVTKSGAPPASP